METQHEINIASWKMVITWFVMTVGAVDFQRVLTIGALILTITYTALQVYVLWQKIKKDRQAEAFAASLAVAPKPTSPAPL